MKKIIEVDVKIPPKTAEEIDNFIVVLGATVFEALTGSGTIDCPSGSVSARNITDSNN